MGHLLNEHDAIEEEERKLSRGDFIGLFKHLHPTEKRKESTIIANMVIQDIIDQIAKSASSEAVYDASSSMPEYQIEFLKQEGISKNEIEKENESGYFEEENVEGF